MSRLGAEGQLLYSAEGEHVMSSDDWYRRTTWTAADRDDFNSRLQRARTYNRPQYIRVQAYHLAQTGNHAAALELLDRFLEIDVGGIDLAQAQLQRAESLVATGKPTEAINAFRDTLNVERNRTNVQTEAWLLFPWFVVEEQLTELYDEIGDVLKEFALVRALTFPASLYRFHCVQAVLSAHVGDTTTAKFHAQKAVAASNAKHSGFRYHPDLGLVNRTNTSVHERVTEIAGS